MLDYDLHCHSNISDGTMTPSDLVAHAASRGVKVLALTDHDDLDGLDEARAAAERHGIRFINGVEISVTWRKEVTIHVVGLNVDPAYRPLAEGVAAARQGRIERARKMADSLAAAGIGGAYEGALRYVGNPEFIGRTHFARFLVETGHAKDVGSVFKRFLVRGKPGYVDHKWSELTDAVGWIVGSGGLAVLAHPGRYTAGRKPVSKTYMRELLQEFAALGGRAIEVVSGSHTPQQCAEAARLSEQFGLLASCGSDYHGPGESYRDMGKLPDFPLGCRPVWEAWEVAQGASENHMLKVQNG
jgi:predicted metal-dependent phosphoesterase TrpH